MSHRAPEIELKVIETPAKPSLTSKLFQDKNLPHWGMFAVASMFGVYTVFLGPAGVPQTISLGFSATLGLWYNYLIRQRANKNGS